MLPEAEHRRLVAALAAVVTRTAARHRGTRPAVRAVRLRARVLRRDVLLGAISARASFGREAFRHGAFRPRRCRAGRRAAARARLRFGGPRRSAASRAEPPLAAAPLAAARRRRPAALASAVCRRARDAAGAACSSSARRLAGGRSGADQALDRGDILPVGRRHEREGRAGAAGAAGAADAVDIVVGVVRHVVVEDVADVRDVEAARGDVGGDQQLQLAVAEALQRRMRARWSRSPWIGAASKPCVFSDLATTSTSDLRLQKTMPFLTSSRRGSARAAPCAWPWVAAPDARPGTG